MLVDFSKLCKWIFRASFWDVLGGRYNLSWSWHFCNFASEAKVFFWVKRLNIGKLFMIKNSMHRFVIFKKLCAFHHTPTNTERLSNPFVLLFGLSSGQHSLKPVQCFNDLPGWSKRLLQNSAEVHCKNWTTGMACHPYHLGKSRPWQKRLKKIILSLPFMAFRAMSVAASFPIFIHFFGAKNSIPQHTTASADSNKTHQSQEHS